MKISKLLVLVAVLVFNSNVAAQSLELMTGNERIFADAQWLKFMDDGYRWSLFSRSRATVSYDDDTDLFTGAYLNYTTKVGLGGSLVGRISSNGSGGDAGVHIFKAKGKWTLFGLASISLSDQNQYSWFSIFRYRPAINEQWKLYSSLELFTIINRDGHVFSVQRIRIGLDYQGFQFGLANNSSEAGIELVANHNYGLFIRKQFN
jgi:hypothetical protein